MREHREHLFTFIRGQLSEGNVADSEINCTIEKLTERECLIILSAAEGARSGAYFKGVQDECEGTYK